MVSFTYTRGAGTKSRNYQPLLGLTSCQCTHKISMSDLSASSQKHWIKIIIIKNNLFLVVSNDKIKPLELNQRRKLYFLLEKNWFEVAKIVIDIEEVCFESENTAATKYITQYLAEDI